jgi:hypothetical protein
MEIILLIFRSMHREKISQKDFLQVDVLNYNKPVQVSSTLGGYHSNYAVDEDIKTIGVPKQEIPENGFRQI